MLFPFFFILTVLGDYAMYDISTTNEVFYLVKLDECYTLIPLEDPTATYYLKVNDNGKTLTSTIYTKSDCTASTTEYSLPNPFQRVVSLPSNIGGVQECGKNPQTVPVHFARNNTCIYVAEDTWLRVSGNTTNLHFTMSHDECKTFEDKKKVSFVEKKCTEWNVTKKKYQVIVQSGAVKNILVVLIAVLFLIL